MVPHQKLILTSGLDLPFCLYNQSACTVCTQLMAMHLLFMVQCCNLGSDAFSTHKRVVVVSHWLPLFQGVCCHTLQNVMLKMPQFGCFSILPHFPQSFIVSIITFRWAQPKPSPTKHLPVCTNYTLKTMSAPSQMQQWITFFI